MAKGRNLTRDEIDNLSLEMQVCHFLHGWNISAKIKTPEDWAKLFGYFFAERYHDTGYETALAKHATLLEWVRGLIKAAIAAAEGSDE